MNPYLAQEETLNSSPAEQISSAKIAMIPWRRVAWIMILLADSGLLAWGAVAALLPERLPGPGARPILNVEYENFTGGSWSEHVNSTPRAAEFITLVFRMYGICIVVFGLLAIAITVTAFRCGDHWSWWVLLVGNTIAFVSAMTYGWTVRVIGPFELTEYLGLAGIYITLAVTAPFLSAVRKNRWF